MQLFSTNNSNSQGRCVDGELQGNWLTAKILIFVRETVDEKRSK
jgi:hypothetical protein